MYRRAGWKSGTQRAVLPGTILPRTVLQTLRVGANELLDGARLTEASPQQVAAMRARQTSANGSEDQWSIR